MKSFELASFCQLLKVFMKDFEKCLLNLFLYDLIVTKFQYNCFGISLLCLCSVLQYLNSSSQINVDISSLSESPSPIQGQSMFGVRSHP